MHGRSRAGLFALAIMASPVTAQNDVRTGLSFGIGLYTSVASLGTRYAGTAHLVNAPALTAAYEVWPNSGALGLRFAATGSLTEGYRVEPTSGCLEDCTPTKISGGRFLAGTASVVRTFGGDGPGLELELGGGVRQYRFGDLTCACEPIPPDVDRSTVMVPTAFYRDHGALLLRLGAGVRVPIRRATVRMTFTDHISRGPTGQAAHDMLIAASIFFPNGRRE